MRMQRQLTFKLIVFQKEPPETLEVPQLRRYTACARGSGPNHKSISCLPQLLKKRYSSYKSLKGLLFNSQFLTVESRNTVSQAGAHPRQLAPPSNTVGFQILDFLQFGNITKRDVNCGTSTSFDRNEISRIVILCHAKKSRIVIFYVR